MHEIRHLDCPLGTRLNSFISQMCEECPTILPQTETKHSFTLALILIKLDFIINLNKNLTLQPLQHVKHLLDELFLLHDDLSL